MKHKALERMSRSELEAMHTGSLLSRLQRLRRCVDSPSTSDFTQDELNKIGSSAEIVFRDTEEWRSAFDDVKAVLSAREHVPTKTRRMK